MSRHFWIGLAAITVTAWCSLDAAFYLGRRAGHIETMRTVQAFNAGLYAGGSGVRLCLRSDRTAPSDRSPIATKTGSAR